jgi:hypothetical protein
MGEGNSIIVEPPTPYEFSDSATADYGSVRVEPPTPYEFSDSATATGEFGETLAVGSHPGVESEAEERMDDVSELGRVATEEAGEDDLRASFDPDADHSRNETAEPFERSVGPPEPSAGPEPEPGLGLGDETLYEDAVSHLGTLARLYFFQA